MPIYEYTCRQCSLKFEILQRNSQEGKPTCPECSAKEVERNFSVFGFSCGGKFTSSSSRQASCSSCNSHNCDSCK